MSISNFFYKKKIIGYNPLRIDTKKRAILYYVTSWHGIYGMLNPYALGSSRGMAKIMAQTINSFGYIVDIYDRNTKEELFFDYDLYIGLCNGGSGQYFSHYFSQLPGGCIKIAYSTGASNEFASNNYLDRLKYFKQRNNTSKIRGRSKFCKDDHDISLHKADALIYCGYKFTPESYKKFKMIKFRSIVPINEKVKPNIGRVLNKKKNKNFVFYSGTGMIYKGLDLVIEVFLKRPDLTLHICIANTDMDVMKFYDSRISVANNITFHGSITAGSKKMDEIFCSCAYYISASCSDGDPSSAKEAMRYGLIPVVTYESDIDFNEAILIKSFKLIDIEHAINEVLKVDFKKISRESFLKSLDSSVYNFQVSLEKAMVKITTVSQPDNSLYG